MEPRKKRSWEVTGTTRKETPAAEVGCHRQTQGGKRGRWRNSPRYPDWELDCLGEGGEGRL